VEKIWKNDDKTGSDSPEFGDNSGKFQRFTWVLHGFTWFYDVLGDKDVAFTSQKCRANV
jgi:hypothetical protein